MENININNSIEWRLSSGRNKIHIKWIAWVLWPNQYAYWREKKTQLFQLSLTIRMKWNWRNLAQTRFYSNRLFCVCVCVELKIFQRFKVRKIIKFTRLNALPTKSYKLKYFVAFKNNQFCTTWFMKKKKNNTLNKQPTKDFVCK